MQIGFLTRLGTSLTLVLLFAGGATAQNASPGDVLDSSGSGNMSCARFMALSASERDQLVRQMVSSAPGPGLSTSLPTLRFGGSSRMGGERDTGSVPGTPLSAGMLVSACQAAPSSASISAAYSEANSGGGSLRF